MNYADLIGVLSGLSDANRPIRLRLSQRQAMLADDLLVKHVTGTESMCGGIEYRLLCVSTSLAIPLKKFIALPVELQFVTDQGHLHSVCGIVSQASAGRCDGGLATYQLVMQDALALMEQRVNTRVFRNMSEVDIACAIVREWRQRNAILAEAFDLDITHIKGEYPPRELTMQHNESDAAFLRRLFERQGIG